MITLGIDTSNYTTSCALFDSDENCIIQKKKLLPVRDGEKGLRQSDAVFHHTRQLHLLIEELLSGNSKDISVIGVSDKPRDVDGSYMPCFTVGLGTAHSVACALGKPLYRFSHQAGHIMAAVYSCGDLSLTEKEFIAFHVSGGTTEMLLVRPDEEKIFSAEIIGHTLDLNCGQAIDRAGVMMGLSFPCGKEMEKLALDSDAEFRFAVSVKEGNCCLSGLENQCAKMLRDGMEREDIAAYCLGFTSRTIEKMTQYALHEYGNLPVLYAGGVMSDSIIRNYLEDKFNAYFAEPDFSCDNAAGIAVLAYLKGKTCPTIQY